MTEFGEFCAALQKLASSFGDVRLDLKEEADTARVFGRRATALARARGGLEDLEELAFTTAEHHPYWNVLYQCAQISRTVLERWEDEMTKEDVAQIKWSIAELENTVRRIGDG